MWTNMTLALQCLVYNRITPTKSPVILHDNLQRESHKPYDPPTLVTWLHLLRKQTKTGTSAALNMQKHTNQCAHDLAHSRDIWYQSRLANVTWNWRWRHYGINHAVHTSIASFHQNKLSISRHGITPTDTNPPLHAYLFTLSSGRIKINAEIRKELEADNTRQIRC